ncbi:hypothetical protein SRHO_G00262290 [Serrasalmus rhombeus]
MTMGTNAKRLREEDGLARLDNEASVVSLETKFRFLSIALPKSYLEHNSVGIRYLVGSITSCPTGPERKTVTGVIQTRPRACWCGGPSGSASAVQDVSAQPH